MANFDYAIPTVLAHEGGYSFNPSDPGGETNFGVSKRAYPNTDIRNLTREDAIEIYRRDFWFYDGILSQPVATKILDTTVNLGKVGGISQVQRIVGTKIDGKYGALTEGAINGLDAQEFLRLLRARLVQHYENIVASNPAQSVFLKGWLARANS